jgi:hypothetical protein
MCVFARRAKKPHGILYRIIAVSGAIISQEKQAIKFVKAIPAIFVKIAFLLKHCQIWHAFCSNIDRAAMQLQFLAGRLGSSRERN